MEHYTKDKHQFNKVSILPEEEQLPVVLPFVQSVAVFTQYIPKNLQSVIPHDGIPARLAVSLSGSCLASRKGEDWGGSLESAR